MNGDQVVSSGEMAEENREITPKHFPNYIPFLVAGLILAIAFFELFVSLNSGIPQVVGDSTEQTDY